MRMTPPRLDSGVAVTTKARLGQSGGDKAAVRQHRRFRGRHSYRHFSTSEYVACVRPASDCRDRPRERDLRGGSEGLRLIIQLGFLGPPV
jgi:hypothetical protein